MGGISLCKMHYDLFIHGTIERHLSWIPAWAVMNHALTCLMCVLLLASYLTEDTNNSPW